MVPWIFGAIFGIMFIIGSIIVLNLVFLLIVFLYTEEGDNIRFKDTFEGGYTNFKLNRLTAKLTAMYFILSDPDSGIVGSGSLINYECTVNVPLF